MNDQQLNPAEDQFDQWIDGLLVSEEAIPTVPTSVRSRVQLALRRKQRNMWALRGLVSAAVLGAVLLLPKIEPLKTAPKFAALPTATTTIQPIATFVGSGDTIVIPIVSPHPEVTIVQVYPTTSALQRWRQKNPFTLTRTSPKGS